MAIWKPTKEEAELIRSVAKGQTDNLRKMEAGIRLNMDDGSIPHSINIALVTKLDSDKWFDTDLFDFMPWTQFRKGVELTKEGRAIVDFYLYDSYGSLDTNIVVYYADGEIKRIENVRGTNLLSIADILSEKIS